MTARLSLLLCLALPLYASDPVTVAATARPEAIRAHLNFLADDLLEGRGTATRGHLLAARYVASQFEAIGLAPAGDSGSWYQRVPLRKVTITGGSLVLHREGAERALERDVDFVVHPYFFGPESSVTAPVVFAGHGITAPDLGRDDYRGIDARGKIVMVISGAPATLPNYPRAHYSSSVLKLRTAAEHGAVGIITVDPPEQESSWGWARTVASTKLPFFRWIEADGNTHNAFRGIAAGATLSRRGAETIAGSDAKMRELYAAAAKGKRIKLDGNPVVTIAVQGTLEDTDSPNVAAVLTGSDPALRSEYVVYTSHLDHIGIGTPVNGDAIYNGAFDNAAGVAGMLEVARLFSEMNPRPRRSILFLAVTAEEKGLLGSDYFANNPTVPIGSIVGNLNIDGLTLSYPIADVVILGAENSSLGDAAVAAAESLGLKVSPDPMPSEVYFARSDQYSFVKVGVPGLFSDGGQISSDPSIDARKLAEEWGRTRYHMPSDDLTQAMNFDSGAKLVQFHFLTGVNVANSDQRPQWKKDDFFGKMFGK
jgi:Zn-dependent M28 family amino/carboxypeptidase